jgi:exodeoxyribonuclease V alpha subunit
LGNDVSLISEPNHDQLESLISTLFLTKIPNQHRVSIDDIQLLVPLHKGRFGIDQLNQRIAQHIRPQEIKQERWVVGDRVMQCRNNYSKHVMNGDIGSIYTIQPSEVVIRFDQRLVTYELAEMEDIRLAYAVSVHKFQGSEAPIIMMPILRQWKFFMSMDVLYTAVTRAKQHLYMLGEMDVLNEMIQSSKKSSRLTKLWQ